MMRHLERLLVSLTILTFPAIDAFQARAETVTLKPAADTSLFENSPDNNLGHAWLASGTTKLGKKSRALIRFDLASIPTNAVVTSAAFTLRVVKVPAAGPSSTFELHRVLGSWQEGTKGVMDRGQGAPAGANEATWKARSTPGLLWTVPGASSPNDFSSTASAAHLLAGTAFYTFASTPELVADVQAWLATPDANFGWILISKSEGVPKTARRIGNREDAANTPTLVVEYTVQAAAQPPQITLPRRVGDQFEFGFSAEASRVYTVETKSDFASGSWQSLKVVGPFTSATNVVVADALSADYRFYRVSTP